MVNRRLREKLEADGRFDYRQHDFRPGYGTSTYFANLDSVLPEAYEEGKHVDIVSLDIAKAFNRTWTLLVLRKLQYWGITGNMLAFVKKTSSPDEPCKCILAAQHQTSALKRLTFPKGRS
ncbi:uncharacterized protein LOC134208904 [Armigeres subalbatus]|uniref:uncharacterized protein LOC134208904 n=1 Tax=Armigeres subalbatus TaxID=124917 RepID=UPI002ECFED7D